MRSSSGAAVTNVRPLSRSRCRRRSSSSHAAAQNEQRRRRWPADDLGQRRPRSAGRAVARDSTRRAPRRAGCVGAGRRAAPLQRVSERADGELGHQPDEVRREAACASRPMRMASWSRAREAESSEPASMRAGLDCLGGCAWPPRPRRRRPARRRSAPARGFSSATGSGMGSPASAGNAAGQLGGQIFRAGATAAAVGRPRRPRPGR